MRNTKVMAIYCKCVRMLVLWSTLGLSLTNALI